MSRERQTLRERDSILLLESARFVEWFRPDIVFAENVAGIRSAKYGGVWQAFEESLSNLGYIVGSNTVCASKFGIPQFRKRAVLLAIRKARLPFCPADSGIPIPESDPRARPVTVREAIGHLPPVAAGMGHPVIPNHRARALSPTNLKRITASIPGESNKRMHATRFGDLSLGCHADLAERQQTAGFTDVYTRMHPDRPSPTITTRCHSVSNGRYGHYDPNQVRGITPREAAVLQSFPDNYVFYPSEQMEFAARLIGNAVPPMLARFFAEYAIKLLLRPEEEILNTSVERQSQFPFEAAV
jgi:DNA (cytosine-5)-methyltransferase 1